MTTEPEASSQLSPFERAVSAAAGLALGIPGCIATFTSDNQFGTGAMIILGGALVVLAITGQPIRRIKIGDHETEFYARLGRKTVEVAASDSGDVADRESALELLEQVRDATPDVPARVVALQLAYEYERTVLDAVARVAAPVQTPKYGPVDAIIERRLGVEVKYRGAGRALSAGAFSVRGVYRRVVERAADSNLDALLLVTNSTVATTEIQTVTDTASGKPVRVKLFSWTREMGDATLQAAIAELKSAANSGPSA